MQEVYRGMYSDTLDPSGEVSVCSVGLIVGMSDTALVVFIPSSRQVHGISKFFPGRVVWERRYFGSFNVSVRVVCGFT